MSRALPVDSRGGARVLAVFSPLRPRDRSFTVAAWVRPTAATVFMTAVAQQGSYNSSFYLQYSRAEGRWAFSLNTTDTENPGVTRAVSTAAPVTYVWTHLVGVYDAGAERGPTASLYVNGVLASSVVVPTPWKATGNLTIGRAQYNGRPADFFRGSVDDVRVWDRVVGASEVSDLVKQTSLAGGWAMDDGTASTVAADGSGASPAHDATLVGTREWPARDATADPPNLALRLDGATSYAQTAGPVIRTDQSYTVAAWVRLGATGRFQTAVAQVGSRASGFYLQYVPDNSRWAMSVVNADVDAPTTSTRALSTSAAQTGVWTHLAGTYDAAAGEIRLYVNGVLEATVSLRVDWNASGDPVLGRSQYAHTVADLWKGELDEVLVYRGALTPADIADLAYT